MIIDWFTVLVQIFNFLVLVYILKYFLYKPIFEAIDRRKQEIENSIRRAEKKEAEASAFEEEYQRKKSELEGQERRIVDEANAKASLFLKEKIAEMEKDIKDLKNKRIEKIHKDEEEFRENLLELFKKTVFKLTSKVFEELAGRAFEEGIFETFLFYLREELPKIKDKISDESTVKLISTQELNIEQKKQFQTICDSEIHRAKYQYLIREENIAGVKLFIQGFELPWCVENSLRTLEEEFSESLQHTDYLRQL